MSKLLIDEYPLLILPSLAAQVGVPEAIILQQVHFLAGKIGREIDKHVWVSRTYEEWHADFYFWSVDTIKRAIRGLEKSGMLISESKFNKLKIDRTKWYRIDYEKFARRGHSHVQGAESPDHEGKLPPPMGQNAPLSLGQIAPSNKNQTKTNTRDKRGESDDSPAPPMGVIACPYDEIVELYHEILPMCPQVAKLTHKRKSDVRARWRNDLDTLDKWRNYFETVSESLFLTGRKPGTEGRPPFLADFDWLIDLNNIVKVAEGKYHREDCNG